MQMITFSQPAYRAFGQIASQPTPNNRFEAATQPPTRSRANWFSSSSQSSFHSPRETWDSLPFQAPLLCSILFFFFFFPHTCYCWTILLTAGFWLCSQVHLWALVVYKVKEVVVVLLGGLKAESFNQLVERARIQLARATKVVNDNLEDVKVSTTFFVIVHTLNVYVKCQKQYWQFWLEDVYVWALVD